MKYKYLKFNIFVSYPILNKCGSSGSSNEELRK